MRLEMNPTKDRDAGLALAFLLLLAWLPLPCLRGQARLAEERFSRLRRDYCPLKPASEG